MLLPVAMMVTVTSTVKRRWNETVAHLLTWGTEILLYKCMQTAVPVINTRHAEDKTRCMPSTTVARAVRSEYLTGRHPVTDLWPCHTQSPAQPPAGANRKATGTS